MTRLTYFPCTMCSSEEYARLH
uniref:Uncharacterized protein n=1 Tax=Arundo donax TaxID=35708 RepID=A0A0A8ZDG4_ARUDO